jgi:hypothetical protein
MVLPLNVAYVMAGSDTYKYFHVRPRKI